MKKLLDRELLKIKGYKHLKDLEVYLNQFSVSKKSYFKDDSWFLDTRPEKSTLLFKIDGEKLNNEKLTLLWKIIVFLILSNLTKIKSYNKGIVRISYNLKSLISFLNEKRYLLSGGLIYLSKLIIDEYRQVIAKQNICSSNKNAKLRVITYWYSLNEYLPYEFQIPEYPFDTKLINIFPYDKNSEKSWQPIEYEEINLTIKEALKLMNYSDDIIKLAEKWWMYYGVNPRIKKFEAFNKKYDNSCGRGDGSRYKLVEIIFLMFKKKPVGHPFEEIWETGNLIKQNKIYLKEVDKRISKQYIRDLIASLYGACLIIILISTGLRKSELYSLQRGCVKSDVMNDIPLLENESFKTQYGVNHIPISKDGVKAISILEKLAQAIILEEEGPLLFSIERNGKKEKNELSNMSSYAIHKISKFYNFIGFEGNVPHLHQYRHTLSNAIWERTEQAPILIQILYHHSSLTMSLRYLRKNPILRRDKDKILELTYKPLIKKIIKFSKLGELAGPATKKISSLYGFLKFKGKTENEIFMNLEDLMNTLVQQDQIKVYLTPLCICLRSNNNIDKSPCMLMNESDKLYEGLPRTDRCVGISCKDSLFSPIHGKEIDKTYKFYEKSLKELKNDDNFFMLNLMKKEYHKYKKLNKIVNKNSVV